MLDEPAVAARRLTVAQARVDPLFAAGMRLTSRNGGKPPSGDPTPRGGAGNCHSTTAVRASNSLPLCMDNGELGPSRRRSRISWRAKLSLTLHIHPIGFQS